MRFCSLPTNNMIILVGDERKHLNIGDGYRVLRIASLLPHFVNKKPDCEKFY